LSTKKIAALVELDSVVIIAAREGFSVMDFVDMVRADTSLYVAFHNLRSASFIFETQMSFRDKKERQRATYHSIIRQNYLKPCRSMQILEEQTTGDFFKKKQQHRYYTYTLFDRLFLTHDTVCHSYPSPSYVEDVHAKGMEKHVHELKNLIFRPGTRSNVPLIGRKTEIFDDRMIDLYQLSIQSDVYDGHPVYIFMARVKDEYADDENKTVFKELISYFHKTDFQVLARHYRLSQRKGVYMFDVTMHVDLIKRNEKYYPGKISYQGIWDIPMRKQEDGFFSIIFSDLN
jgi:hypothetical protein